MKSVSASELLIARALAAGEGMLLWGWGDVDVSVVGVGVVCLSRMDHRNEMVEQFMQITRVDRVTSETLLEQSNWDLESAVTKLFDAPSGGEQGGVSGAVEDPSSSATLPEHTSPVESGIGGARDIFTPAFVRLLVSPFNFLWRMSSNVLFFFASIFPFFPRLTGLYASNRNATRTGRAFSGRDTADRFIRQFLEDYGETALPFFPGGYSEALSTAKREARYLIVVLQSDEHDETIRFNRYTLKDSDVAQFVIDKNALLWAGSVAESEAFQVANSLACTKFPFVALVAPTSSSMSVISKSEGATSPAELLRRFTGAMTRHAAAITRVQSQRAEQNASREIRAEQDSAYELSLQRDRERARLEREEREEAERAESAQLSKTERKAKWKIWRSAQIPPEPVDGGSGNARIQIRLPNGERVVRKFHAQDTIDDVYAFVECRDVETGTTSDLDDPLVGELYEYTFQLVTQLPRQIVPNRKEPLSSEPLLFPNGTVIVEALD